MGDFKEWLSDNLRYFLVGVVVILIIGRFNPGTEDLFFKGQWKQ